MKLDYKCSLNPFSANLNMVLAFRTMLSCTVFFVKKNVAIEVLPSYRLYRQHGCESYIMIDVQL
jgi:hypothetical protein